MTQIHPTIRTMTWNEAREFGLLNRGLLMDYDCISYRLSAGTTDDIHTFKSGATLFVLTVNTRLDYIGFDAYIGKEEDPIDSIFLQDSHAIEEVLGRAWRSMSITAIASILANQFA
ncbi:MAG: hypothetical protein C0617_11085 [Desulfuromonas sp.]|uniref:hypothetical protein n=1 Tax=Desulfuromonas sp. TaxID=892 RepID=UPI000CAE574A|nr:hypothetical protein [Desulfuromonas sp.]PLX83670.1 MAG: hypothetical protein C0617_11085 [Desulfuromonas sp.]